MRRWISFVVLVLAGACAGTRAPVATPEPRPPASPERPPPRLLQLLPRDLALDASKELRAALAIVEELLFQPSYRWPDPESLERDPAAWARAHEGHDEWVRRRRVKASRLLVFLAPEIDGARHVMHRRPAALALVGLALEDLPAPAPDAWPTASAEEAYRRCAEVAGAQRQLEWEAFCRRGLEAVAPAQWLLSDCAAPGGVSPPTGGADVFVERPDLELLFEDEEERLREAVHARLVRLLSRSVAPLGDLRTAHPGAATATTTWYCPAERAEECHLHVHIDDDSRPVMFAARVPAPTDPDSWVLAAGELAWTDGPDLVGTAFELAHGWGTQAGDGVLSALVQQQVGALGACLDWNDPPTTLRGLVELGELGTVHRLELRDPWGRPADPCLEEQVRTWTFPGERAARVPFLADVGDFSAWDLSWHAGLVPYVSRTSDPDVRLNEPHDPEQAWRWAEDVDACTHRHVEVPEAIACVAVGERGRVESVRVEPIARRKRPLERLRDPTRDANDALSCLADAIAHLRWSTPERATRAEVRLRIGWSGH